MPIKKAAIKALRQNEKHRARNVAVKNDLRAKVKALRKAIDAGNTDEAAKAYRAAVKALDKAAQKKIIKKNTAARKKSRLAKHLRSTKKS